MGRAAAQSRPHPITLIVARKSRRCNGLGGLDEYPERRRKLTQSRGERGVVSSFLARMRGDFQPFQPGAALAATKGKRKGNHGELREQGVENGTMFEVRVKCSRRDGYSVFNWPHFLRDPSRLLDRIPCRGYRESVSWARPGKVRAAQPLENP